MIKKILKLFKNKKKSKTKVAKEIKKNKKAEVINFINKSKRNNKIQTNADEAKKMDNLAKELVENYLRASRKSFLDMGYCFYLFLFRVLQRMIFQFSYPVYRHYLKSTSKEILNNHKEWLHEFEEWDQAPTEGNLIGEKKKDSDNDTLH
tara:strand:+ start:170 stop:616 length:447 start_codon:yes stop_codon:yes gene_type:complete